MADKVIKFPDPNEKDIKKAVRNSWGKTADKIKEQMELDDEQFDAMCDAASFVMQEVGMDWERTTRTLFAAYSFVNAAWLIQRMYDEATGVE